MIFDNAATLDLLTRALILGPIAVLWIVLIVQLVGLRSFSKMTAFDFIVTIATGSLLANAASTDQWPVFLQNLLAMGALLAFQALLAWFRRKNRAMRDLLSNDPVILFRNGRFEREAMARVRVDETDIWAKMREANVLQLSKVQAVVLETTGDISVLHGDGLEDRILTGVSDPSSG
ncbi:DUF421 domain-containing protein [Parasphingopyxis lamellibrachiae]|uniref:Uncharacterized protein DUF421 n=1 Tax=Parasphingopyxis lamellibrachiae TaxID=680125 RepID=A0A3D9FEQ2_9SPHN|nr:YetF domain-containing protein [Parasphingopyxis lamellibrachiae]RED16057.1 uncharacterized protein DUF421 [Parasphingopyxis lamellibrachiae]